MEISVEGVSASASFGVDSCVDFRAQAFIRGFGFNSVVCGAIRAIICNQNKNNE